MRRLIPLVLLLLCAPARAANDAPFEGSWWGLLDVGAVKLHVVFDLHHHGTAWSGTLASPDQNKANLPLGSVAVAGDTLTIEIPQLHVRFEGKRVDADHIRGTFTQGAPFPLTLQRGTPPSARRPQEPKPPFPYASEDVTVENRAAKLTLGCTLTHPHAPRFPVVVFITGSGQQDRDETLFGHKPFWVLADALARKGIGGLRCDDRGMGKSTGDFRASTTLDFAGDVAAELAWLRARPDVDARHLGLLGHSEGGLIAPIVAARDHDVAFLVLLAGPGLRGDEILLKQQAMVARSEGMSGAALDESQALERKLITIVAGPDDAATARKKLDAIVAKRPPAARANLASQLDAMLSPWYREFLRTDPRPYLREVTAPVLALNGSRDVHVPSAESLAAIRAALAGNHDATVEELPGLNHLFQTCKRCTVDEYGDLEETMSPQAITRVTDWVQKHALTNR
ncbi:MAG TPA: alpha/beta fold hydrolase [Polyangia bacterium]|nr:alpha/beta fold hydrolase [Polyangia bacterium]